MNLRNLLSAFFVLLILLGAASSLSNAAAPPEREAGCLVLVNSQSPDYKDFENLLEPYLIQFGVPYAVRDISKAAAGTGADQYALIVVGHRDLDAPRRFFTPVEEQRLLEALKAGTGMLSFDGLLAARSGRNYAPLYDFPNRIFGFAYRRGAEAKSVVVGQNAPHFIAAQGQVPRTVTFKAPMIVPGVVPGPAAQVVAQAGELPLIVAAQFGSGRAVLFASYEWVRPAVKGKVYGMDDLVWRSLVWAARKPFVLRGMPKFLAFRVDDVSGFGIDTNQHLGWVLTSNRYGLKPWLGVFIDDMREDPEALKTLSRLTKEGQATAFVHARRWSSFFFLDEPLRTDDGGRNIAGKPWPDEKMAANWKEAEAFFAANGIVKSKVGLPHFYQFALNNFAGLARWGAEFVGTVLAPGAGYGTPLVAEGPYLTKEPERASSAAEPLYIADWLKVPGHPEYDRKFFNFAVEIRDVAGYEWAPSNVPVEEAVRRGVEESRREFDSMLPAVLFTHESDHIQHIPPGDWDRILSGVMEQLKPYQPVSVTLDELCHYLRALHTSKLESARYDPATGRGAVRFSGSTDTATKFYVWDDTPRGPEARELEAPIFRGLREVSWTAAK